MSAVARPGGLRRPLRALVYLLFLRSGACGLIHQVAWSRILTQIPGIDPGDEFAVELRETLTGPRREPAADRR